MKCIKLTRLETLSGDVHLLSAQRIYSAQRCTASSVAQRAALPGAHRYTAPSIAQCPALHCIANIAQLSVLPAVSLSLRKRGGTAAWLSASGRRRRPSPRQGGGLFIANQWPPAQVNLRAAPRAAWPSAHGAACQAPGPAGVYGAAPPTMRAHLQAPRQDDAAPHRHGVQASL